MKVTVNFKRLLGRGFGGYIKGSVKKNGNASVIVDIDAMLNCCLDKKEITFKQLFSETVTHEIYHAIEELFEKSFNHKRINTALRRMMK